MLRERVRQMGTGERVTPPLEPGAPGPPPLVTPTAPRMTVEPLDDAESWTRLRTVDMGRVALTVSALPVIMPVFFGVVDESVVFRAEPGSTLARAAAGAVVAFEAGEFVVGGHEGWSVMIRGVAREIVRPELRQSAQALPLRPVTGDHHGDALLVVPGTTVTGRRICFA